MKILITGASGFVGGNFLQRFSSRSDLDILGVARRPIPQPNYRQIDLCQTIKLDFKPDVVIHAAAHVSPWGSKQQYHAKNIAATQNVVNFCEEKQVSKLIYLSSSSVYYRDEAQLNIQESTTIVPDFINDYAATKYAGEQIVKGFSGRHTILRPRAIFGPGDTVLFPRILEAAQKKRLPLFKTPEPVIGDLIYIDCLTDYMLHAALNEHIEGEYNLTNAEPIAMQPLLLSVLERLGLPKPKKTLRIETAMGIATVIEAIYRLFRLSGEPPLTRYGVSVLAHSKTFDVSKMLRDFGPPSVSIEEGITQFIQWQQNHA